MRRRRAGNPAYRDYGQPYPGASSPRKGATLDAMSQTVELPRPAGPDSELGGHWRVIVRNDDHNTFDHVAQTLARHIPGVSVDKGYAIADLIHNQGQAMVWSGQKEPAELYWELLSESGLTMAPLEQG
jgi:ATP-dependent Clp protease adaptor protein ClpS